MNRKLVLLIVLSIIFTVGLGFSGFDSRSINAAPTFEKVNFISAVVTANLLNVRQGPSTNFPVVCVLKKGQWVNVIGKLGDWYAVYEPESRCVGAVSGEFIKEASTTNKTTTNKTTTSGKGSTGKTKTVPKVVATPKPTASIISTPITGVTQDDQTLLNLVNKARADAGVGSLQFDAELMKVARLKAKDMVDNNYFSHQSPTYGSPFDMMRQFGISFKTAGENIAGNRTVEGAFQAWMNSEGHKKNILNSGFNYTGIGIVDSSKYGKMLVQQFIGK
ncbi:CAP domain-containing protein [Acetivibrio cellulolyticus]|uniref:CAP domain-containing protein n=1 Tax=Acetivibrio cellulolyticus TaxID=35830 RepID=UPI0001E2E25B|nr:CAP domain-containing protein [Acetivibrio cellulolyticus]